VERGGQGEASEDEPEVDARGTENETDAECRQLRREAEVGKDGHREAVVRGTTAEAPGRDAANDAVERSEEEAVGGSQRPFG
jgi:hypothetical protein